MPILRISLGHFDAGQYAAIRQMLDDSQASLIPAISALAGNLAFYAGIDQENGVMSNVSIWENLEDARQMDGLPAMRDLASRFTDAGVRFDRPITNHETLWRL